MKSLFILVFAIIGFALVGCSNIEDSISEEFCETISNSRTYE